MKFLSYSRKNFPDERKPGMLRGDRIIDLSDLLRQVGLSFPEGGTLRDFIELGSDALQLVEEYINAQQLDSLDSVPRGEVALQAPLGDARKLILLAGNYIEHIREVGFRVPPSGDQVTPQFFMKPPSTTIIGPDQSVEISDHNLWVDWEVELAVVIAGAGRDVPLEDAMQYVFGYTILNDISERKFNSRIEDRFEREKDPLFDWLHGKWFDGFAPMGPCVVTKDEIPDPHSLQLLLYHNGKIQQEGSTADMLHPVPYLIHKLSEIMTIEPGDVIATGTPSGVGVSKGRKLEEGDVVTCKIDPIGELRTPIISSYRGG